MESNPSVLDDVRSETARIVEEEPRCVVRPKEASVHADVNGGPISSVRNPPGFLLQSNDVCDNLVSYNEANSLDNEQLSCFEEREELMSSKFLSMKKYVKSTLKKKVDNGLKDALKSVLQGIEERWVKPVVKNETSYSVSERINYYNMLNRAREMKKAKKKLRKYLARGTPVCESFEASSVSAIIGSLTKAFSNVPEAPAGRQAWSAYLRNNAKIVENDDDIRLFSELKDFLPEGIDFTWVAYLLVVAVQLYMSESTAMDILILAQYTLTFKLTNQDISVINAILPMLSVYRMAFRKKSGNVVKTESASDFIYDTRALAADFISSHFMMSVREIILILASYRMFSKDIADQLYNWLGKVERPKSFPEAISKIVTDIANLIKMGESLWRGEPVSDIFLAKDPMNQAAFKARELLIQYGALYFGLPVEGQYDARTWVVQSRETMQLISSCTKKINPYDSRIKELQSMQAMLLQKVTEVKMRCTRARRPTPYFIVVNGPPGIGKSSLVTWLYQLWSFEKGRKFDQSHVFEKNAFTEYYDGYDPFGNPIMHLSEVGAIAPKLAEAGKDSSPFEICSIVDSQPYSLNIAECSGKGNTYCLIELLVVDTNCPDMNAKQTLRNSAAFKRRAIYIEPVVKPEFRLGDKTCMLDGSKHSDDFMDKWTFTVTKFLPVDNETSITQVLLDSSTKDTTDDIYGLYKTLEEDMRKHIIKEETVMKRCNEDWFEGKPMSYVVPAAAGLPEQRVGFLDEKISLFNDNGEVKVELMDQMRDEEKYAVLVEALEIANSMSEDPSDQKELIEAFIARYNGRDEEKYVIDQSLDDSDDAVDKDNPSHNGINGDVDLKDDDDFELKSCEEDEPPSPDSVSSPSDSKKKNKKKKKVWRIKQKVATEARGEMVDVEIKEDDRKVDYFDDVQVRSYQHELMRVNGIPCLCCDPMSPLDRHFGTFMKYTRIGGANAMAFVRSMIHFLVLFSLSLPQKWNAMEDYEKFALLLIIFSMLWLTYYSLVILVPCLFIVLFSLGRKYVLEKADVVATEAVNVAVDKCYLRMRDNWSNVIQYIRSKQTLAISCVVGVSGLYLFGKLLEFVWRFSKRISPPNSESNFRTVGDLYEKAKKVEEELGMMPPPIRLKSKLNTMVYENVVSPIEAPVSTSDASLQLFHIRIRKNERKVITTIKTAKGTFESKAIGVGCGGSYMLLPAHIFYFSSEVQENRLSVQTTRGLVTKDGLPHYTNHFIVRKEDLHIVTTDIVLIHTPGVNFRSIVKDFPTGLMSVKNMDACIGDMTTIANDCSALEAYDESFKRTIVHNNVVTYKWMNHESGTCSTPLTCKVGNGYFILGLHVSAHADSHMCYSVKVTRQMVDDAMSACEQHTGIRVLSEAGSVLQPRHDPMDRSFVHYIELGPVKYHGMIANFNGNQKTNIVKSIFGERPFYRAEMNSLLPEEVLTDFRPAIMRPTAKGSPITNGARKLCVERKPMNPAILEKSISVIVDRILKNLDELKIPNDYAPFDFETVFNGSVDDYLARAVDASKSGGFGYPGKKGGYMYSFPKGPNPESGKIYEPKEKLLQEVLDIISSYRKGEASGPIFKAALKDELRTLEKIKAFKTRVFYASPFPFLVVQKAIMAPLYTLMVEHSQAFYAALGIDMHKEGHFIKQRLGDFCTKRGSSINCVEGDYGGFDTTMPYGVGEASCQISRRVLERLGYNPDQMEIVDGVLTDLLFPKVDFFGDLITVPGLQPSGKYATAEDNSLRNLVILVYTWYSNPGEERNFFDHVLPVTYGDDIVAAVLDDAKESFNNCVIADVCATIGLEFTSSSKGEVSEKFIDFDKISFLKRTFAFHEGVNREVARLSLDSIYKMLEYIEPSKVVNAQVQYESICRSALVEFFFWSNEESYSAFCGYILETLKESFPGCVFKFPTYGDLCQYYTLTEDESM